MSTQSSPHSIHVRANGLDHHVLVWPPDPAAGSGPAAGSEEGNTVRTVFLIHGIMDASGTWDLVAPALAAQGLRVLAPDMRGFGRGPRAPAGSYYHFVDYVFDLAEIVEELAPEEPLAIVGHSAGGTIATLFAGTFPERVVRLAVLEGVGPPDTPFETAPARMRAWIQQVRASRAPRGRARTFTRDEALARLMANHPDVPREILEHRLPHLVQDAGEGRLVWHFDPLHRTTSPVPFFAASFIAFAKRVTCPVLFVSGGDAGYHPEDEATRLDAFANCTRATLGDAGHMIHWTRPAELANLLVAHLRSRPPS